MNVDDNDARQRALLLHYAGEQVYDIFETLTDTGESDDFDKACEKLTAYFSPKKNIEYEVYVFRKEKQEIGETLDTYHTRLRRLAAISLTLIEKLKHKSYKIVHRVDYDAVHCVMQTFPSVQC